MSDIKVCLDRSSQDSQDTSTFGLQVKRAIALDIRECRWSREQIADELSARLGQRVSVAQLDAFTAESKHFHRFPAEWIPAWYQVTGSRRLPDLIAAELGLYLADGNEREFAEYGRVALRARKLESRLTERI